MVEPNVVLDGSVLVAGADRFKIVSMQPVVNAHMSTRSV
jgi:hypothetical protein